MTRTLNVRSVPMTYSGVRFRSTLEADWASTLDSLGIVWSYEPEAVLLPGDVYYRPDFWLPEIHTWLEVKGPHDVGLEKARLLASLNPDWWEFSGVVVGRSPVRGMMTYEAFSDYGSDDVLLNRCRACGAWYWYETCGSWSCRRCGEGGNVILTRFVCSGDCDDPGFSQANALPFVRALRNSAR